jgi:hypothetical protein
MAAFTQVSSLNGFFYEIYDKIVEPIPEAAKFMAKVPYKGGALEIGNKLHLNVVVSDEAGFTYAARDEGAFPVNDGVSFETQDAQVDAFQLLLQGSVDYESAARASSSRKAFLELVGKKLQVMVASTKRRFESELWYGQSLTGLGTVEAVAGAVVTIDVGEWAPMMWQGRKGHRVNFYATGAAGALRANTPAGGYVIQSVNLVTRQITFTTAIDASVVPTDVLVWHGSYGATRATAKTCAGNIRISSNTGTMFNIDGALYDVWTGNTFACGAANLTFYKIMAAMGLLANRGLDGDVILWTSPATWSALITDQAALRRYSAEIVTVAKNGAKGIEFFYQTGKVTIIGHGMMKEGYAVVNEMAKWKRVGAQDFSFKTPGLEEGRDIFWHDPNKAGFSYRYYGAQSLFCEMPSHQLVFTGIVNSDPTVPAGP